MYMERSAGRTAHIQHIPYNFDKSSGTYLLDRPIILEDDHDPAYFGIGTTRLPRSLKELSLVLWRFWDLYPPTPDVEETEDQFLARLKCKSLALEQVVIWESGNTLSCWQYYTSSELWIEDIEWDGLWACPIWTEPSEIIFYCNQKKLVVDHMIAIVEVQQGLRDLGIGKGTREFERWKIKFRKGAVRPLPEAVRRIEVLRDGAVKLLHQKKFGLAVYQLTLAMMEMMPWFPLLWYMDAWESQANGLADVLFECNNYASYGLIKLGCFDLADMLVNSLQRSPNRTVKQLHQSYTRKLQVWDGREKQRSQLLTHPRSKRDPFATKVQKDRHHLIILQSHLRRRPAAEIAAPHWFENFDPRKLVEFCRSVMNHGTTSLHHDSGVYRPFVEHYAQETRRNRFNFRVFGDKYFRVVYMHIGEPEYFENYKARPQGAEDVQDTSQETLTEEEITQEALVKAATLRSWSAPVWYSPHTAPLKRSPLSWRNLSSDMVGCMTAHELYVMNREQEKFYAQCGWNFAEFQGSMQQLVKSL